MKTFIKSASRVKVDPPYHQRKINQLQAQRDKLFAECERIDPTGCAPETREEKVIRAKIDRLQARINYHFRAHTIAWNILDQQRRG